MLYHIPENVPLDNAALIEPLAVAHHAIKASRVKDWSNLNVLVVGAGPIGMAMIIALLANGATKIVVSEPASARREQLSSFVKAVINPIEEDVGLRCMAMTGEVGMDIGFDCAGVPQALDT